MLQRRNTRFELKRCLESRSVLPLGRYFARLAVRGKLIWKLLNTDKSESRHSGRFIRVGRIIGLRTLKRGGHLTFLSWEELDEEAQASRENYGALLPEKVFDRR